MIKELNLAVIFLLAIYSVPNAVHAVPVAVAPTVSWYWQGSARANYSLTVNTGSALVLGCLGKAKNGKSTAVLTSPAFVITKGSAPTLALSGGTISAAASTDPAAGVPFSLTANGGTLIWDSVNGNAAGFDHILAIASMPTSVASSAASGYVQLYIPSLATSDAGLYYCTFYDGLDASATIATTSYANSGWFSLTLTTKSGSGSSKSAKRNKAFEYSIALLGASKMLF